MYKQFILNNKLYINHFHYQEITSTQTYAKHMDLVPDQWILISADHQVYGKGRIDKVWKSSACGNIYATLIVPLDKKYISCSIMLPQVIAVSIIETLIKKKFMAKLKWVNDIFINNKKVCGILCEQSFTSKLNLQKLLIGFGINVNATKEEFIDIEQPATSLLVESGKKFDQEKLLYDIVANIHYNLNLFLKHGFNNFLHKILKCDLLQYKNQIVTLEYPVDIAKKTTNLVCGELVGLSNDGGVILSINKHDNDNSFQVGDKMHKVFNFGKLRLKEGINIYA